MDPLTMAAMLQLNAMDPSLKPGIRHDSSNQPYQHLMGQQHQQASSSNLNQSSNGSGSTPFNAMHLPPMPMPSYDPTTAFAAVSSLKVGDPSSAVPRKSNPSRTTGNSDYDYLADFAQMTEPSNSTLLGGNAAKKPIKSVIPPYNMALDDEDESEDGGHDADYVPSAGVDSLGGPYSAMTSLPTGTTDASFFDAFGGEAGEGMDDGSGDASPADAKFPRKVGRKPRATQATSGIAKDTQEYQRQRKENHKNVEKKRRETINDGIKRLACLIPNADKNKSKIINQAAEYIEGLKQSETENIERWTLEKLKTDNSIRDLQAEREELRDQIKSRDTQITELRRLLQNMSAR